MDAKQGLSEIFSQTKIEDVMNNEPIVIKESADLSEVQLKFKNFQLSHLLIVNDAYKLVGLISQKYLYKTQSPRKVLTDEMEYRPDVILDGDSFYEKETLDSFILRNVMMKSPFTLQPEDSLQDAFSNMAKKNLGCIPVVDKDLRIKGVLTDQAIVRYIASIIGG